MGQRFERKTKVKVKLGPLRKLESCRNGECALYRLSKKVFNILLNIFKLVQEFLERNAEVKMVFCSVEVFNKYSKELFNLKLNNLKNVLR